MTTTTKTNSNLVPVTKEFGRILSRVMRKYPKSSKKEQYTAAWQVKRRLDEERGIG